MIEHRLNVGHIGAYSGTATDKGCAATIKLANEIIIDHGVIEHLPQYDRVLAEFMSLLKPRRYIFLDGMPAPGSTSFRRSW